VFSRFDDASLKYLKTEIHVALKLCMMPELMINAGWTKDEIVSQYKPRFLHALNALSDCKLDKPLIASEVVVMMDKPAQFNPDGYKTIRDSEASAILSQILSELANENYVRMHADSIFATNDGLEKSKSTDPYWKRTSNETYDCDEAPNPRKK
jgi:hypothetical protein